jgi:hypothetical protein
VVSCEHMLRSSFDNVCPFHMGMEEIFIVNEFGISHVVSAITANLCNFRFA